MSDNKDEHEHDHEYTVYLPADIAAGDSPTTYLVSSAQVRVRTQADEPGQYDHVLLWVRGGFAGFLTVPRTDSAALLQFLGLVHRSCPACGKHGPEES